MRIVSLLTCWLVQFGLSLSAHAQVYSLNSFGLAGSGPASGGGAYSISGALGRSEDTALSGGSFALGGGFGSLIFASQPSGALPVAVADRLSAKRNQAATVSAAKLLSNDSHPDGEPISVTGAGPRSTQDGTVVLVGGVITYTPSPDFIGSDSFIYSLSDGIHTAIGEVSVNVVPESLGTLNIVSPPVLIGGQFRVTFAGIPNFTYAVQGAEMIDGPWVTLQVVTAPATGVFEFIDATAPPPPTRFYRTQEDP